MSAAAGAEVEVRRTVSLPPEAAWQLVTGPKGLGRWVGGWTPILREGTRFTAVNGSTGAIEAVDAPNQLRLRWAPARTGQETIVQLTVEEAETGAAIGVHHERLAGDSQRELMRAFWQQALENLAGRLG